MIKRILVISLCVALISAVFVFPASAATIYDYNDYIGQITTSDGYDTITLNWPGKGCFWEYEVNEYYYDGLLVLNNKPSSIFYYSPFMYPTGPVYLSKSDIPDDAKFTFRFACESTLFPTICWYWFNQYDSSGNIISSEYFEINFEIWDGNIVIMYNDSPLPFVEGCDSFTLHYQFNVPGKLVSSSPTVVYNYDFSSPSWDVSFSLSSAYRQQQQTNKTNNILKEVEKQLADQGKTLDDVLGAQQDTNDKLDGIINDKVDPSLPSGGDIVGDLDDAEGQIRDDAQSGLDQGAQVQQSAIQVMGQYLSAFACVSWIFDRFSTIPFVSGLLALSFSLGITGAILGIGISIARSYSGSSRSSRSSRSKGG